MADRIRERKVARNPEGNNIPGNSTKKEDKRRSWTAEEEEVLLRALKELVVKGEKTDNGFKAGYQNKLEAAMKKVFPNCGLKATPHINSKLTAWKRTYSLLVTILRRSGVGFNLHGNYRTDCDGQQYEACLKLDDHTENVLGKSWPMFDDWKEVFRKDRATGEGVEDVIDMVNEMIFEHSTEDVLLNQSSSVDFDSSKHTEANDDSGCQSSMRECKTKGTKNKKRKKQDQIQNLTDMLPEMHDDTSKRLQSLVGRIGYQIDLCKAKKEVFIVLSQVPDLSLDNQFEVGEYLVHNPSLLEYFMGLSESARLAYVYRLLNMKK